MQIRMDILSTSERLKVHVEHHIFNAAYESVILVNGAISTSSSFHKTIKYLGEKFNVICFDPPHFGRSREHNASAVNLTKEDEVEILHRLVEVFEPRLLLSVSWGGVASLLMLARPGTSIRRAVVGSFSPVLNPAMAVFVKHSHSNIVAGENRAAAMLLNDTLGKHLPRLLKFYNRRYLCSLSRQQLEQVIFQIEQVQAIQTERYLQDLSRIQCDIKFINGELDEYTTGSDVQLLAPHLGRAEFATVAGTGHFLDLEGQEPLMRVRHEILGFFDQP